MKEKKITKTIERESLRYRGTECLNCGQPLDVSDVYCPYCSQKNTHKQLTVKDFLLEFLSSILVYDSRLRNTLKDLLFRPGVITRNYVKGQRLKYANPFRFFLSVSIIYFLVQGAIGVFDPSEKSNLLNIEADPQMNDSVVKMLEANQKDFPDDENLQKATGYYKDFTQKYDSIKEKKKIESHLFTEAQLDSLPFFESYKERFSTYNDFYDSSKIKNSKIALDSLHHKPTRFNKWLYSRLPAIDKIQKSPFAFLQYLMAKIPFFLFFFTPFFAFFFLLLYSNKKHTYMEHMIFIFHIFSFVFLGMLIFTIPDLLLNTQFFISVLFLLLGPFYFYKALRNFYKQSRIITLIKFVILNIVFLFGFGTAALLFVIASAAMY